MVLLVSTDQSFASDDFDEKVESEFEERLAELDKQYQKLHEEFGFVELELSEEENEQFEERLEERDSKYEQIF